MLSYAIMSLTFDQRLDRLAARLEELPCWLIREYRDLPHWTFDGEPISLGQGWPERRQAVTFAHGEIEVPPDWPLEQTRLDLDLGGEGLLYIRYPSREEGFGLDPYHRRFPLLGRSCSLEARVVPHLPFGVPNRQPSMVRARLVLVDVALERLIRQLRLVLDAAWTLHPADVVPHLMECAERAIDQLDWPSHTWPYLSRLRHSPQMLAIWEPPIGLNDRPPPLDDVQQRIVAEVRERLEREVRGLRERFPPQGAIALTGQAHLDLAWLWPLQETRHKARRTA
ncbi:MAG: alpha-mannosidase, partial [Chloroflexota bacterium]|nr:alpha-mannosidase [Chloroflexota bacterium]